MKAWLRLLKIRCDKTLHKITCMEYGATTNPRKFWNLLLEKNFASELDSANESIISEINECIIMIL
jgi:hypothetical protein